MPPVDVEMQAVPPPTGKIKGDDNAGGSTAKSKPSPIVPADTTSVLSTAKLIGMAAVGAVIAGVAFMLSQDTVLSSAHPTRLSIGQMALVQLYLVACATLVYLEISARLSPSSAGYLPVSQSDDASSGSAVSPSSRAPPDTSWRAALHAPFLRKLVVNMVKFGSVMMCYIYTSSTGNHAGERHYDRDTFWALMILCLLAGALTITKTSEKMQGVVLNRDQTEEWKGWMQVIFLAYHYFHAGNDVYNLVRVLIGAYVWMTGFGHFIYFYQTKQYDIVRVVRTMLRLNFLVFFTCLATENPYMLYYICPLHTFFFFMTYFAMYLGQQFNYTNKGLWSKFGAVFVFVCVLWSQDAIFSAFFWLLTPLLQLDGTFHEWQFRTGLDRFAPLAGMICGYLLPFFQQWLVALEKQSPAKEWSVKAPITVALVGATYWWYQSIYLLPKVEYNANHPYFEMLPILSFLWLRNLTHTLRSYHMHMFAWWGKVTLESYISQLHILMTSNAKAVLVLFPGYPLITMIVCSLGFGVASKVLNTSTIQFSLMMTPTSSVLMIRNFLVCGIVGALFYATAAIMHLQSA
jgi:hypothetical protein